MIKKILCALLTINVLIVSLYRIEVCCTNIKQIDTSKNMNSYTGLNDSNLLKYVKDNIYTNTIKSLDSDKYIVENVKAVYISKEYIEELEYNSKNNIYFGYTLQELDEQFQGKKYYFTVGENGEITVKEVESISSDDAYNKILKNVAIGSGVILICVTVSLVTVGSPAVSMIFATSAKTATTFRYS